MAGDRRAEPRTGVNNPGDSKDKLRKPRIILCAIRRYALKSFDVD